MIYLDLISAALKVFTLNILRRMVLPTSLVLILILVFIPISPLYAASTCAGFIPATITTQANLIAAVNAANNETNCPGADVIDLNGQTITMTTVSTTSAGDGVALPEFTTNITIEDGTLYRDPAAPNMKFIYVTNNATVVVNNMTLQNGVGTLGSAIDTNVSGITLTISNSSILNNTTLAGGSAGAVHFYGDILTVQNSIFRHNTGATDGGAISHQGNTLNVTNSIFEGNRATTHGAAINSDGFTGTLNNLVFVGNSGNTVVRLIYSATMNNVLMASNMGIPIHLFGFGTESFTLNNSIVWGNNATPLAINNSGGAFSSVTVNYSAVESYSGTGTNNITDTTQFTLSDFAMNPLVGATAGNTGLNYNPALYDWTLRPFSPAIDSANNTYASTSDVIGATRRVNDTNVTDTGAGTAPIVDMGAYERQASSCSSFTFPYTLAGSTNEIRRLNLRDAIRCANLNGASLDVIDLNGQTVTYATSFATYGSAATALPQITTPITLQNGIIERSTTGGTPNFRLLSNGTAGTLTLNNVTVRNGLIATGGGAGIRNDGVLEMNQSVLNNNTVTGSGGGGLSNNTGATAVMRRSTISGNTSSSGSGGGIANLGTITVSNSTLSNNVVITFGAALFNTGGGSTTLINSTVTENQTSASGGAIYIFDGNLILSNNILANSIGTSTDCGKAAGGTVTFSPGTSNIIESDNPLNPCGTAGTNYLAVDPQLGTLTGSPAYYPISSASSPAVNAGDNGSIGGAAVDQPGNTRTQQTTVDLGAYESPFVPQVRTIQFNAATSSAAEAAGFGNVLLVTTSDGAVTETAVTVTVAVSGGTATIADYALTGTITIPAGTANNALVSIASGITVTDDSLFESAETVILQLGTPTGAVLGAQTSTTHTLNNDETAVLTTTAGSSRSVNEGAGTDNPIFRLDITGTAGGTPSMAIAGSFDVSTVQLPVADAAISNIDYTAITSVTTNIPIGTVNGTTYPFSVVITNDAVTEGNEFFDLAMSNPVAVTLTTLNTAAFRDRFTIRINANDPAGITVTGVPASVVENVGTFSYTLRLDSEPTSDVVINLSATGCSVPASITLTNANWNTATNNITATVTDNGTTGANPNCVITYTVNAAASADEYDLITEPNTTVTVTNDDTATVTIADVSQTESGAFTFTATLSDTVAGGFTVNYATANGTATTADNDYVAATGTLTFAGTLGETQTFTVTINGDAKVEANETLTVSLNTVSNVAVTITDTATGTITNDDTASVTIADVSVVEGNSGISLMTFTATLDNAVQDGFTVNYATANGTATTADADYVAATGALTFAGTVGETETFMVIINRDTKVEANETLTVSLNTVSNAGVTITDTATGTITNDDAAAVTIADVSQAENGTFTFTATLDNATGGAFSVDWALAAGTTNAADYVGGVLPTGGTLNFAGTIGETQTFTVPVLDDAVVEPTETFTISMTNFTSAGGFTVTTSDTATGTITDNDTSAVTIADVSVAEGNAGTSLMTFTATLGNAVQGGFTVNYATANGTATTGDNDYVGATGTLTFAGTAGETQTFSVTINGDTILEPNETFTVSLNGVSNALIVITDTATGTITNDDAAGYIVDTTATAASLAEPTGSTTFTIRLTSQPVGTVILDFASSDTTECTVSPLTFTFNAGSWNTAQTITINVVDDLVTDGTQPCAATITRNASSTDYAAVANPANVTLNITDNETPGITMSSTLITLSESGGTTTFDVSANTSPLDAVSVPLTTDGQCEVDTGGGFGTTATVTLPSGSTAIQSVTVRAVNDTVIEGAHTCVITTGDPTSPTDTFYDALTAADVADVIANVSDNDVLHTLTAGAGGAEGTGVNPTYTFTITRSGATNVASSIDYSLGGTGVSGTDYVALNPAADITGTGVSATATAITFAANATTATVTIKVNADSIVEANFTLDLTFSNAVADSGTGTGTLVGTPATLTVTDDDAAGYTVDTTGTAASIGELAGVTTFTIRLASQPTGTVILDFASTDTTECTVSPSTLTFNNSNWSAVQTITITAADDLLADGTQPCAVTTSYNAGSTSAEYVVLANPANVTVNVTDNETPGITVNAPLITSINELGGTTTATFTIVLNTQPTGDVTIPLTASDATECAVSPTSLTFTALNWSTAQTVTITSVDDVIKDGDQPCVAQIGVTTSTDTNYDVQDPADITVTVVDNDIPGLTFSAATVTEGAGSQTYTVQLNTQPTADVQITAITPDAQCTISGVPLPLTFTTADWNIPQTITVTAVDDTAIEGNHLCVINHTVTSTDADYTTLGTAKHTANVVDNESVVVPTAMSDTDNDETEVTATATPMNGCTLRLTGVGVVATGQSSVARLGDTGTWTYTVENLSPCDLADVNVLITFPDDDMVGVQATSSLGINGTFRKGSLLTSYTLGTMKPGQSVTLTIVTKLPDRAGLFLGTLTATVGGIAQPENATLQLLAAAQLPATGETPWWAGWVQGGTLVMIGATLLVGIRRVYFVK